MWESHPKPPQTNPEFPLNNPIKFEIGALTVDPQSSAYDPRPLIPYLAELGVPYLYEEQAIMKQG